MLLRFYLFLVLQSSVFAGDVSGSNVEDGMNPIPAAVDPDSIQVSGDMYHNFTLSWNPVSVEYGEVHYNVVLQHDDRRRVKVGAVYPIFKSLPFT